MHSGAVRKVGLILVGIATATLGVSKASAQTGAVAAGLVAFAPGGNVPVLESDVVGVVPENAYGVIIGGNILETKALVERVMRKLNIPFDQGDDYAEFTDFLESLRGWDAKASHAIAFLPGDDEDDVEIAVFVPVTNYKEFAASLGAEGEGTGPTKFKVEKGPDGYIASKAGFAVLVETNDEEVLTKVLASKKSVSDIGPAMRAWVGKQQAAGLVLPAGLAKILDEIIDGMEKAKKDFPAGAKEAAMIAGIFDVYSDLIKAGRDEVTMFAMGVRLNENTGLDFAMQATFRPEGKLAAAAKSIATLPSDPLSGLPEGEYFAAGAGILPQELIKNMMDLSMGMAAKLPKNLGGSDLSPEDAKALAEATAKSVEGVRSYSMSVGLSGKSFLDRIFGVMKVDDSAKFMANYEKQLEAIAEIAAKSPESGYPGQTVKKKKIGGRDVLLVTTDIGAVLKQVEEQQGAQAVKMFRDLIFGGDKLVACVAAVDAKTVVMTYSEEAIGPFADDVKQGKPGLADDANIRATASMLPADLNWVGYMNIGGYMEIVKKFMGVALAANGGPGFFPPIPPFPDAPPIGFSASVNSASLEGHVVVPIALAESVRDYVMQLQGLFGGGLR
jgi:hypothetical protein